MPARSKRPRVNFHQPRFMQISESHCGPAVIKMLLSHLEIDVTQEDVAEAGGATQLIELNGMRIDQLALAVKRLAGQQAQFWWKDHARLKDLLKSVRKYGYPTGVEWQGVFEDEDDALPPAVPVDGAALTALENDPATSPVKVLKPPDSESDDDDFGHYSVVTAMRLHTRTMVIADPYKDYFEKDRIFTFRQFLERWWDYNEVASPRTGRKRLIYDYRLMFVITPPQDSWPALLKMHRG